MANVDVLKEAIKGFVGWENPEYDERHKLFRITTPETVVKVRDRAFPDRSASDLRRMLIGTYHPEIRGDKV